MRLFTRRYEEWGYQGSYEKIEKKYLRINTLRTKTLPKKFNLVKVPFLEDGYESKADFSLASSPEYLQGLFYLQDASTQLAAEVLNPQQTDRVLDMAAAPGGKTTHLAARMKNKGVIVALDSSHGRIQKLKNNLERLGVANCVVYQKDAQYVSDLNMQFDKVLLDAPCSGNFSLDAQWFEKRDFEGINANARLQKKLLRSAVGVCKPGGIVLYCTCSLEKEENEDVIEWALDELNVELVPINEDVGVAGITEKTALCKRIWPGETQGFFLAKLKKV
jgi:NOL1/NOP2/sun family putative RNA methylase